jgi:hypothetical protein
LEISPAFLGKGERLNQYQTVFDERQEVKVSGLLGAEGGELAA